MAYTQKSSPFQKVEEKKKVEIKRPGGSLGQKKWTTCSGGTQEQLEFQQPGGKTEKPPRWVRTGTTRKC